jgi:hypothetical protein
MFSNCDDGGRKFRQSVDKVSFLRLVVAVTTVFLTSGMKTFAQGCRLEPALGYAAAIH